MLTTKVGLVDTTGEIDRQTMAAAAAALNVQVTRDLPQFWSVNATVAYLPDPHNIPQGVWPVQLVKELPPGEGGFHMTAHNQPYAKVIATPGSNEWTVDASHETVEMLVDPNGNRLQTSTSIEIAGANGVSDGNASFEYLVEACDPCEADQYTYEIDGIRVSDFITPHFYDLQAKSAVRYSFTGAITRPREILPGGYISWTNPQTFEMQQILWVDPGQPPQLRNLGRAPRGSLRLFVESKTYHEVRTTRAAPSDEVRGRRQARREVLHAAGQARAGTYE
jgi:hypothetical protein